MRTLTRDEAIEAAKDGRLYETGNDNFSWFEVDGEHVDLNSINKLIGEGVLAYRLEDWNADKRPIVVV